MYQFTDDCRIGIPQIDDEHAQLFSLINEGYSLLAAKDTDLHLTAKHLIAHLREYADTHFTHEEAYMRSIGDPELSSQQQEHQDFIAYLDSLHLEKLDNVRIRPALENLLNYLSHWLFHHIIGSDTLIGKFESPFSFTSKYLTDIPLIDDEHKRLFEIIKDANDVIHAELLHDKYDEILHIISDLKDYTAVHFADEEAYMEKIGYPELESQKKAHTAFIDKLADINLDDLDAHQQNYLEDLISFLLNWLSVHILHMDKKIGEFVANLK